MINFNEKKNGSDLMTGKEKGTMPFGQRFTLKAFDILENQKGKYAVYTIVGDEAHFYFGATAFTKILEELAKHPEEERAIASGAYQFYLEQKRTKSGNNYTNVVQVVTDLPF